MRTRSACVVAVALLLARAGPATAAVEVQARLDRSQIAVGESAVLQVVVRGAGGGVSEPSFVAPGLEVLASGREQSFSWINGRSSAVTVFRYGVSASRPGTFVLGPIRVKVGGQVYRSSSLRLTVAESAPAARGGAGGSYGRLLAELTPEEPWVGQAVSLRVRLVLGADLAEDPNYLPPSTSGFWTETPGPPESYVASQGGRRVLVTETRTVLYPLAAGRATIGPASADLLFADGAAGPLAVFGGPGPHRAVTVRSAPVAVNVRPLPPGAPAGFDGAVGALEVRWSADRARTALDVPVTVRLDLRGEGNLPLTRAPRLVTPGCDVFANTVDDSFATPDRPGAGRRRFRWTVLARREGRLEIPAPLFAWFDPGRATYREARLPAVAIEVQPALTAGDPGREGFPRVFSDHPVDPFAGGARPWGWALAGLMLGAGVVLLRAASRPEPGAAERARAGEWKQALRDPAQPEFWRAADQAAAWLAARGHAVAELRAGVAAARYGGAVTDAALLRERLRRELDAARPAPARRAPARAGALALALAALAVAVVTGPRLGEGAGGVRLRAADGAARDGDLERAAREWAALWREGARHPALAARLGWGEVRSGAVGRAALWVLRGARGEPRDPALRWVADRVRESGGLTGDRPVRLPVRRVEWASLALALGVAAGAAWPRRALAGSAAVLALACGLVYPAESRWAGRAEVAVVERSAVLEGPALELEPGQVVRVVERAGARARVTAGRGITGWLPAQVLLAVAEAG